MVKSICTFVVYVITGCSRWGGKEGGYNSSEEIKQTPKPRNHVSMNASQLQQYETALSVVSYESLFPLGIIGENDDS